MLELGQPMRQAGARLGASGQLTVSVEAGGYRSEPRRPAERSAPPEVAPCTSGPTSSRWCATPSGSSSTRRSARSVDEFEHGDTPPYDVLRKLFARLRHGRARPGTASPSRSSSRRRWPRPSRRARPRPRSPSATATAAASSLTLIPIIELCRVCPGHGHRHGRVDGPHLGRHQRQGHHRPEGAVGARAAHHGEDRRLGHHRARLRLRRVRLDEGHRPPRRRRVRPQRLEDLHHQRPLRRHHRVHLQARRGQRRRPTARSSRSCSTGACPASSSPSRCARWACTRRPPASCSSTTCGSASTGSSARPRTSPAGGREGAKATFMQERSGVAAMALGIIEECLDLSVAVRQGPGAVRPAHRRVPADPGQAGPHGGGPPQRREPRVPHHRDVAPPATR